MGAAESADSALIYFAAHGIEANGAHTLSCHPLSIAVATAA